MIILLYWTATQVNTHYVDLTGIIELAWVYQLHLHDNPELNSNTSIKLSISVE